MRNDKFRTEITEKVIELMKSHGADWVKPWASQAEWPTNSVTKAKYHGINVMLLMMAEQGSSEWASYKQWASKGAQVKKGRVKCFLQLFSTFFHDVTNFIFV